MPALALSIHVYKPRTHAHERRSAGTFQAKRHTSARPHNNTYWACLRVALYTCMRALRAYVKPAHCKNIVRSLINSWQFVAGGYIEAYVLCHSEYVPIDHRQWDRSRSPKMLSIALYNNNNNNNSIIMPCTKVQANTVA